MMLQPGDVFLVRGSGFFSRMIRLMTQEPGEGPTYVSHAGIIVTDGTPDIAMAVEALNTVKFHPLQDAYGDGKTPVAIYRPSNISSYLLSQIASTAGQFVGDSYGWGKIALHAADYFLGGRYVFRRLGQIDNFPICSYLVARAYSSVGFNFGVPPAQATPDDCWDFIQSNPDKWKCIHPLSPLPID